MFALFGLSFILLAVNSKADLCPAAKLVYPCTCTEDFAEQVHVVCEHIENDQVVRIALRNFQDISIYSFTIKESTLNYIPYDLFKGLSIMEIELATSSLISLSNRNYAFEGLEDTMDILTITNCSFMTEWNWSHLSQLRKLFRIDILGGDLDIVSDEIAKLAHLPIKDLAFSYNQISWIYDYAFANFSMLITLTLSDNQLTEIKRSMFPNPAPDLMYLDFSNNKLRTLPKDIFTNMPTLSDLSLFNNQILTLEEDVFSGIWNQLELFGALGNPLRCDCRMIWITAPEISKKQHRAICSVPPALKGRMLHTLDRKELWC